MIILCFTEGFLVLYAVGTLVYSVFIWAGLFYIHNRKYPLVLLADAKGIHYFIYVNILGYSKKEIIVPWKIITFIKQYPADTIDEDDVEDYAIDIGVLEGFDKPLIIWLNDTDIYFDTIGMVLSKLNEMRDYYYNIDERTIVK